MSNEFEMEWAANEATTNQQSKATISQNNAIIDFNTLVETDMAPLPSLEDLLDGIVADMHKQQP